MKSDPGNDELVKKMAETLQSEVRRMLLENQCDYDTLAAAALAVARQAIKEECAEKVKGQRLIWNKGTSAYTALTDAEAAIRAMEK